MHDKFVSVVCCFPCNNRTNYHYNGDDDCMVWSWEDLIFEEILVTNLDNFFMTMIESGLKVEKYVEIKRSRLRSTKWNRTEILESLDFTMKDKCLFIAYEHLGFGL